MGGDAARAPKGYAPIARLADEEDLEFSFDVITKQRIKIVAPSGAAAAMELRLQRGRIQR